MAGIRGVDALLGELEKTKLGLKDVDKDLAKLTGRDPTQPSPSRGRPRGPPQRTPDAGRGRERIFNLARRSLGDADDGPPPAKRRSFPGPGLMMGRGGGGGGYREGRGGGAFSRLGPRVSDRRMMAPSRRDLGSGDEEDRSDRPAVQSSVVANPATVRSREQVAENQSKDKESKGRNQRMFGLLLGTLQRFKAEERTKEDKEKQRKAVDEKLEQKAKNEQLEVRKERRKLFLERQAKEEKIKRLEQKMDLVEIHEQWAKHTNILGHFIRTKATPHLYYLPKQHVSSTRDKQKQTKEILEKIIKERRKALEEEIDELTKEDEPPEEQDRNEDKTDARGKNGRDEDRADEDEDEDMDGLAGLEAEVARAEAEAEELGIETRDLQPVVEAEEGNKENIKEGGGSSPAAGQVSGGEEEGEEGGQAVEEGEKVAEDKEDSPKKRSSRKRTHSQRDDDDSPRSRRESGGHRSRNDSVSRGIDGEGEGGDRQVEGGSTTEEPETATEDSRKVQVMDQEED